MKNKVGPGARARPVFGPHDSWPVLVCFLFARGLVGSYSAASEASSVAVGRIESASRRLRLGSFSKGEDNWFLSGDRYVAR